MDMQRIFENERRGSRPIAGRGVLRQARRRLWWIAGASLSAERNIGDRRIALGGEAGMVSSCSWAPSSRASSAA